MDIGFVHIGMAKTATTTMQTMWYKDDNYCLSHKGTLPFLYSIRNNVLKNGAEFITKEDVKLDNSSVGNQKIIISNEGFSSAYLNDIENQNKIPQFIECCSKNLSKLTNGADNLLIVVREPISWIKSIYIQAIKQGEGGSAQEFVSRQEEFILHSLDLKMIIDNYRRWFGNILVLPYEMFVSEQNIFWELIGYTFNVPVIDYLKAPKINVSINKDRVFVLSELNKYADSILELFNKMDSYTMVQEKKYLNEQYKTGSTWVHRRMMEHLHDNDFELIKKMYKLHKAPDDFYNYSLSPRLVESIQANFIDFLCDNISHEFPGTYREEFSNYLNCMIDG